MKKTLIVFLVMMLTRICAFSSNTSNPISPDSTVLVPASSIKYANLIFAEHKKLLIENQYLYTQIDNLTTLNKENEQINSLQKEQLIEYKSLEQNYLQQIESLNTEVKKKNNTIKYWQIGGITVSVGLLLLLLLK